MALPQPTTKNLTHAAKVKPAEPKPRLIELDILRGFLLLWMTFTHLPTRVSIISNQTFGFVSGAEGFIFLAAFMVGQIENHVQQKTGELGSVRDTLRRAARVYLYHCGLLLVAFTLVAVIGVSLHRLALQNLLSFYLQHPKQGIIAALLLEYRPSLLDILPMYIIFLLLTPLARKIAHTWSWKPVIVISLGVWIAAQFGLRAWLYNQGDLFGLSIPQNATGSFDLYGWQLLWMVGLALGSTLPARSTPIQLPQKLVRICCVIAALFLILRYSPVDQWMNPDLYGKLIDKWHLGAVRIVNFSAITVVIVRFGATLARLPSMNALAPLGQASIEVFSVHVLSCLFGVAQSHEADPSLSFLQQTLLIVFTISALFLTADRFNKYTRRKAVS